MNSVSHYNNYTGMHQYNTSHFNIELLILTEKLFKSVAFKLNFLYLLPEYLRLLPS